jgi:hypothetical protein
MVAQVRFGTGFNLGSSVGNVVGNDLPTAEDQPAHEVLGPDTEAGQALLVLAVAFVLLWISVGPGGTLVQRAGRVLGSVALVGAAMVAVNFTARTYALRHPNGPLAAGLTHDL